MQLAYWLNMEGEQ